jgi:hypothetical protein
MKLDACRDSVARPAATEKVRNRRARPTYQPVKHTRPAEPNRTEAGPHIESTKKTRRENMTIKGAMIAAAVAGLFATGASGTASAKKGGEEVVCDGINSCKGQGSCHGANNACAGKNGCKGQGHTKTSKEDCLAKGGKIAPAAKK